MEFMKWFMKSFHNFPGRMKVMMVLLSMQISTLILMFGSNGDPTVWYVFLTLTASYWLVRLIPWGGVSYDEACVQASERMADEKAGK